MSDLFQLETLKEQLINQSNVTHYRSQETQFTIKKRNNPYIEPPRIKKEIILSHRGKVCNNEEAINVIEEMINAIKNKKN